MSTIRVVLADDHAVVRDTIHNFLDYASDIEVVGEASNGIEALHLAKKLVPDVLLLDMEMPGLTGSEVTQRLRALQLPVYILALSAYDDWQYVKTLLDNGAAGYLTKNEPPEIIIEAIRGVAQGEKGWVSRQVARQISARPLHKLNKSEQMPLTGQEEEMLRLIVAGKTNREISATLGLSTRLVETYLATVFAKLGVNSRVGAAVRAVQEKLI